ncbi:MAG TPA: alpha/beta fold hydrolase [Streptosporangiaceae bacterium]|nr:alpha/beta fold hydrolase [Streptosporangiaceae bacterium]
MIERHPVVFLHGLWLHASSWGRWVELFAAHGYTAVAPGWPGDELTVRATRGRSGALPGLGIGEISEHYARIAGGFPARPVLIGHGLGGLLALTLAAETHAAGVIAIDTVPVSAMPPTREPLTGLGAATLSRDEFRVVYGSALSRGESDRLYERWAIPAPQWALREAVRPDTLVSRPGAHTTNSSPGPVLLMASGKSRRRGAAQYPSAEACPLIGTDMVVFHDRGPSLVIDSGWRLVAESCLSWMDAQEL